MKRYRIALLHGLPVDLLGRAVDLPGRAVHLLRRPVHLLQRNAAGWSGVAGARAAWIGVACLWVVGAVLCPDGAFAAHDPVPAIRIPLNPMGYETPIPEFLAAGSAMATVDFADASHLLVTFGLRGLMKRDPADPPEDDDRLVGAVLVALPSGKVVARTEWHLHDRGQYLWNVGDGRFLLRVRNHLSVLEPTRARDAADVFRERPFLHLDRRILAVTVSAERDLLTIQTTDPPAPAVILADGDTGARRAPVQINFYRLTATPDSLVASSAGTVRSEVPVALPVNSGGFLNASEAAHNHWLFHYNSTEGKLAELAGFDTTCYPHTVFVSEREFVAFGCRGAMDDQDLAGFDLSGGFMWQQGFFDRHVSPSFAFAPAAGRFALGRTIVSSSSDNTSVLTPPEVVGQDVRVYQTWSGKVVFRIACTPAMRAGQNFALSPDGMHLAVLRQRLVQHKATQDDDAYAAQEPGIEIYDLPALSKEDEAAVRESRMPAPPVALTRIDVAIQRAVERQMKSTAGSGSNAAAGQQSAAEHASADVAPAPPAPPVSAPSAPPASGAVPAVQPAVQPAAPRKPPTLYAPDEAPDSAGDPTR